LAFKRVAKKIRNVTGDVEWVRGKKDKLITLGTCNRRGGAEKFSAIAHLPAEHLRKGHREDAAGFSPRNKNALKLKGAVQHKKRTRTHLPGGRVSSQKKYVMTSE